MSAKAIAKIRTWRRVIEEDAIEHGFKKPSGRLGQGHDHTMSASASLAHSRLGECQVYSGPRIPVNPTYLTVEVAIAQLPIDHAERQRFRVFVFNRLRTMNSLASKGVVERDRMLGNLLLAALSQVDTIRLN